LQWCWQLALNISPNFPSIKVIPMTLPVNQALSINDAELLTRIGIALQFLHPSANRVINASIENGVVTLTGQVPTYYDRQLAFHIVRRVAGVRLVRDELNVAANSFNAWEQPAPPVARRSAEYGPRAVTGDGHRLRPIGSAASDGVPGQGADHIPRQTNSRRHGDV
jgi:hypothetical protein